jgi:arginine:ornithine antiporter / lysine permease
MLEARASRELFSAGELVVFAVSVTGAVTGVIALATGWITV